MKDPIWKVIKILPTDYEDYGGQVVRWADDDKDYPDCSVGCKHFRRLNTDNYTVDNNWGVCWKELSPRFGLLTWEHQAGYECYET